MRLCCDLGTLTDKELLEEFADRVLAYEDAKTKTFVWKLENNFSEEDCDFNEEYADLKIDEDEKFCLVRECVRFVKNDETLLLC